MCCPFRAILFPSSRQFATLFAGQHRRSARVSRVILPPFASRPWRILKRVTEDVESYCEALVVEVYVLAQEQRPAPCIWQVSSLATSVRMFGTPSAARRDHLLFEQQR